MTDVTSFSVPTFELRRQDALGREQYSKNAVQKEVFVVAKNLAFLMEVGSSLLNMNRCKFYARLYYDNDYVQDLAELKPVDFVNQEPMSYKTFVTDAGDRATVELRVIVLSSQHEDSLFRVKIGLIDPASNLSYEVTSEPIKVLSKPSLVNKKPKIGGRKASSPSKSQNKQVTSPPSFEENSSSPTSSPTFPSSSAPTSCADGPNNDQIISTLHRLEQQQQQQQRIMEQILLKQNQNPWSLPIPIPDPLNDCEFEKQFHKLLAMFNQIPAELRATKMRKVLSSGEMDPSEFLTEASWCFMSDYSNKRDLQLLESLDPDLSIPPQ